MRPAASFDLLRLVNPLRLTGAIFGKELRVAGRRRRNYVLRSLYVTLFAAFVILVWLAAVPAMSTGAVQASRMGEAGLVIIFVTIWFQFIVSQIVAVVIMSTAISDEIYHKTLGLLMTTPISSLQIVLGKLTSRLLQVVLLLGMSLPLLAIVRVFGGIPWDFLYCALSVTSTSLLFCGSLSLFLSIFSRRAYAVIIETVLVAVVLFLLLPVTILLGFNGTVPQPVLHWVISLTNPYAVMMEATERLMMPGSGVSVQWPGHCCVSLAASALLVILSMIFVRKAALRQAVGQEGFLFGRRRSRRQSEKASSARIRRIIGPPVFWRERRMPLFARTATGKVIAAMAVIGLLLFTYGLCARERILDAKGTHIVFGVVFVAVGILTAVVLPATCITLEKESRAWPILLATPIRSWDILWGKFVGAILHCAIAWVPVFAHVMIFSLVGLVHPVAILQLGLVAVSVTVFLCSTGLYFSSRFKHTTTAIIGNLALAAGIWLVLPMLLMFAADTMRGGQSTFGKYLDMNPIVQTGVILEATAGRPTINNYEWAGSWNRTVAGTNRWLLLNLAVYAGVGLAFAARALTRLRRDPFD